MLLGLGFEYSLKQSEWCHHARKRKERSKQARHVCLLQFALGFWSRMLIRLKLFALLLVYTNR